MFRYPKMPGSGAAPLGPCVAFEKYDGTNLHWEWDRHHGWFAFGTRSASYPLAPEGETDFAANHTQLHEAPACFRATHAEELAAILARLADAEDFDHAVVFTEFFGPQSFAGLHKDADPKQLVLFDVWASGFGFFGPRRFVNEFADVPIARVVYEGKFTGKFAEDVRKGKYPVAEGVVCKGGNGGDDVWMVKIKTYAYQARLKQAFAGKWEDYWE
ncbi:RNA ligase family protein [Fimbriiglobus ruber]|uniref:RNA ligase domain-containing protein n=1 Tax=Fimbriiglobus ruber TaxID=1908690 RepID=A0A225EH15_9BACT|nr:RNA ligase family protein [Fimbriiglobus ruber]OWK47487.1 hypothetical protein FRUB_01186 [Fimbriiglobus ruber]